MTQVVRLADYRRAVAVRQPRQSFPELHRPYVAPASLGESEPNEFGRLMGGIAVLVVMLPFALLDMIRARRIDVSEQDVADHYFDRRPK